MGKELVAARDRRRVGLRVSPPPAPSTMEFFELCGGGEVDTKEAAHRPCCYSSGAGPHSRVRRWGVVRWGEEPERASPQGRGAPHPPGHAAGDGPTCTHLRAGHRWQGGARALPCRSLPPGAPAVPEIPSLMGEGSGTGDNSKDFLSEVQGSYQMRGGGAPHHEQRALLPRIIARCASYIS